MRTVSDTPIPSASELSNALGDAYAGDPTVTDPVALFATACIQSISSGDATAVAFDYDDAASIATGKRGTTSREAHSPSPRRKRRPPPSSPKKAARAVAAVVTQLSQTIPWVANLPSIRCNVPLPTSVITDVFEVQPPPPTKKRTSPTSNFIGHVPKTKLFKFCRGHHFNTKIKYTDKEISDGVANCRMRMLYHFNKTSNVDMRGEDTETTPDASDGPNTRSSVEEIEDWMVEVTSKKMYPQWYSRYYDWG